jgi:ubiquinone/menaquinone biosynthesis C-methylase UbiE
MAGIYTAALERAGLEPGEVVVDIGTGRGELLAVAVQHGAVRAIGVEYSPAAVKLAQQTVEVHGIRGNAEVILADARRVPLDDGLADLVTLLDVVEHLTVAELDGALAEAYRLLRPGGRLLAHTFPTRTVYDVYRWQRRLVPGRRRRWPANPRHPLENLMHVNEQTVRSLRAALRRAGFREPTATLGAWVFTDFVPSRAGKQLYKIFAKFPPTRPLGVANLWGEGVKPA